MTDPTVSEAREALLDLLQPLLTGEHYRAVKAVDALIAAVRAEVVVEMENEGVVTWGDERHRERFLNDE